MVQRTSRGIISVSREASAMLQVFRKVANFGAHSKKSTNSKEIIDIEKGEADVMLELNHIKVKEKKMLKIWRVE